MSYAERHTVSITTATGGGATGFTPSLTGRVAAIAYAVATGNAFASTADFTITTEQSGQTLWSESNVTAAKTVHPTAVGSTTAGGAATGNVTPIWAANERIKIAIAQGGNAKGGTFTVIVA